MDSPYQSAQSIREGQHQQGHMVNLAARQKQMPHLGQGFAFPFRMSQQVACFRRELFQFVRERPRKLAKSRSLYPRYEP
ncbi:MAG: hypothetical protein F6K42_20790 [Leptolyngbya sp. SIO1D8]|nr:hypothetical protein [Leptolyngbya sp. SIO1D8]